MIEVQSKLDRKILEYLKEKSYGTTELVTKLMLSGVTKQGIYARLRKLKKDEIIVLHNKRISLNTLWISKSIAELEHLLSVYTKKAVGKDNVHGLEEGDSVTYRFRDPNTTDSFWGHAMLQLLQIMQRGEAVYLYNPHQWFLLVRRESEMQLVEEIVRHGCNFFLTVGSKTNLDEQTKKVLKGKNIECHVCLAPLFKNNYYVNVFGEYVIEVWLDKKVSFAIDAFYHKVTDVTDTQKTKLKEIVSRKGNNKMVISRNKVKAEKIRKRLAKYFY